MGVAYLPDGTLIDYEEYIASHPHWQKVRRARFDFDGGKCVICHKDLHNQPYQTHHLHYQRLGHERIRDVITLCATCHHDFHQSWQKSHFWKGKEDGHWDVFNLHHTALLCSKNWRKDKFICRDPDGLNLCSRDVCRELLEDYLQELNTAKVPIIDPNDLQLFVRNKRYELYFEAEANGQTVEEFLDSFYGPKVRGQNPLRQEAGRKNGPFDHTPESFHRHYAENKNIITLMEEVNHIEETQRI
ncbi:MAG: hypothetical protein II240_01015 [Bacteroidaceae bacterium]|nr:hypothetical protein [Bacteroidaceae bacterium]